MARSRQRRALVIVGGVNGCGKSTFAREAAGTTVLLGQTAINPDDLTQSAAVEFSSLGEQGANVIGVERAEKAVWRALAESLSVAIETVLSSDKFVPVVKAARKLKYDTRLIFVALPTVEVAIERVKTRVRAGGHDVPEDKVRARWKKAHANLAVFLGLVDDVVIYANDATPEVVAERIGLDGTLRMLLPGRLPSVEKALS